MHTGAVQTGDVLTGAVLAAALALGLAAGPLDVHAAAGGQTTSSVSYRSIAGAQLRSVLPADGVAAKVSVAPFQLRTHAVTHAEFRVFAARQPQWRRDRVPALLAGSTYLSGWGSVTDPAPLEANAPVVRVSWYAARAYCASEGARLPRWHEWELAAAADATQADARDDDAWLARILGWYANASKSPPGAVGMGEPNVHGIHDLHGLIWEWVDDYSGLLVNADSRARGEQKRLDFCGGAAVSLADRRNYAVLMRLALLSAMEGQQDGANLGFRCARDGASSNSFNLQGETP